MAHPERTGAKGSMMEQITLDLFSNKLDFCQYLARKTDTTAAWIAVHFSRLWTELRREKSLDKQEILDEINAFKELWAQSVLTAK